MPTFAEAKAVYGAGSREAKELAVSFVPVDGRMKKDIPLPIEKLGVSGFARPGVVVGARPVGHVGEGAQLRLSDGQAESSAR